MRVPRAVMHMIYLMLSAGSILCDWGGSTIIGRLSEDH